MRSASGGNDCRSRLVNVLSPTAARADAEAAARDTVHSGWPGIGGVLVPYSQALRKVRRSRWEILDASAMKSYVEADRPNRHP